MHITETLHFYRTQNIVMETNRFLFNKAYHQYSENDSYERKRQNWWLYNIKLVPVAAYLICEISYLLVSLKLKSNVYRTQT